VDRPPGARRERYFAQGNHFAAAITFFSILTAVPLLMVAFAAASLSGSIRLLASWRMPRRPCRRAVRDGEPVLETAIDQRTRSGIGSSGRFSGVWWMSPARGGVGAVGLPHHPAAASCWRDLRALSGWARAALPLRSRCSAPGSRVVLGCRATDGSLTRTLLRVVGIVLGVGANWLIFAWAITAARTDVALRGVGQAALLGAVGSKCSSSSPRLLRRGDGHPECGLRVLARPAALRLPGGTCCCG
jgi:membrane protein